MVRRSPLRHPLIAAVILTSIASAPALAQAPSPAIKAAVANSARTPANRARDQYRHPPRRSPSSA
jgi:predicted methyltransferase